ncbi:MAG: single-stranded DNA-binding protein [Muribaculaceae bacterium]|nr:single-stranded DNA-binding protein [Muribaculaceae bacterium]
MNKVILLGYVGKDPEIRYIGTRPVASFSLATTEPPRKLADGSQIPERTEWHNIVMWDHNAQIAERYVTKGTRLMCEGKLRTRVWEDKSAIKRYVTEIVVDTFELLNKQ